MQFTGKEEIMFKSKQIEQAQYEARKAQIASVRAAAIRTMTS